MTNHNDLSTVSRDEFVQYLEAAVFAYQAGEPIITDAEYDSAEALFSRRFPGDSYLSDVRDSTPANSRWGKMEHKYPVAGLAKCQESEGAKTWARKNPGPFIVEEKLDGISIEMVYRNGTLVNAITRGKNNVGEDIVRNVRNMKGVPEEIVTKEDLHVRGEIFLMRGDFEKLLQDGIKLANPRNAAAGIAKRLDGTMSDRLTVISYAILNHEDYPELRSEWDVVSTLEHNNFIPVKAFVAESMVEVEEIYRRYENGERASLGYDIDGLVVKTVKLQKMEFGSDHPDNQIAWKFAHQSARTIVKGFLHSISGGRITPVALLEPVFVAGVTISKASLHNYTLATQTGIGIGSEVEITRRNDVIPQVERVFTEGTEPLGFPEECPECHGEVGFETNINGHPLAFFECKNPECPAKAVRQIERWLSACDTKGIGPEIVKQLYDAKIVRSLTEFLAIDYGTYDREILALPGMERKKLAMLQREIEKTKDIPLITFLKAMDFPGIGTRMLEKFLENQVKLCLFGAFNPADKLTLNDFIQFYGAREQTPFQDVGTLTMAALRSEIQQKLDHIKSLEKYVTIRPYETKAPASNLLEGKSFCFTGEMFTMAREEAQAEVKKLGGESKSGVSAKLTYLVTNDPNSGTTKNKKARELGVSVISEPEFLAILGRSPAPEARTTSPVEAVQEEAMVDNPLFNL